VPHAVDLHPFELTTDRHPLWNRPAEKPGRVCPGARAQFPGTGVDGAGQFPPAFCIMPMQFPAGRPRAGYRHPLFFEALEKQAGPFF